MSAGLGLPDAKLSLIINGIESTLFKPGIHKKRQIAFMPRKNSRDSLIVQNMLSTKSWMNGWSLMPIDRCSQESVASILQDSLLFLSFGHPEGFGLPVAEALACGCAVVGYSGLGGRELFTLGKKYFIVKEVAFGDWVGFVQATHEFIQAFDSRQSWLFSMLRSCSESIRSQYNESTMQESVDLALCKHETSFS